MDFRALFFRGATVRAIPLLILSILAVAGPALAVAGCGGSDEAELPTYDLGSFTTKSSKGPVSSEAVENIVVRKLGDTDLAGGPMVRKVSITPEGNGQRVDIEINRTSSCHPGQVVGIAVGAAQQIMSAVFRYDDVSSVNLTLYGTTEEPADRDKMAARILVTKQAADGIDWFQFNDASVEKLANEFWAEPLLYANWKQFGGAAITDETQREAANAAAPAP